MPEPLNTALIVALLGAGGFGGLITAFVGAWLKVRQQPLEEEAAHVSHQVDLTGAANQLVKTQGEVIVGLQLQLTTTNKRLDVQDKEIDDLKLRFQKVLNELENERLLARDLNHELEGYRLSLAERDERINQLESRVAVLEDALREADIDPDALNGS